MKKRMFQLVATLMIALTSICTVKSQTLATVKGIVVAEDHLPVAATITVKGTKRSTATETDGSFMLRNVSADAILVLTGASINNVEVPIHNRADVGIINTTYRIVTGNAVVVEANTGYQQLKPNETNGSVVVVDKKLLNAQSGTNVLKRIVPILKAILTFLFVGLVLSTDRLIR